MRALGAGWRPDLVGTLLFVVRGDKVLLIRKKRGHGAGKINGPGGKLEGGETPLECAVRETLEEVGVVALAPQRVGLLKFLDTVDAQWLGHVYLARDCRGEPCETEEARPLWFPMPDIPYDEMWEDDRIWLPRVLAGSSVNGEFLFTKGRLKAHSLTVPAKGM
jgi:8-oxo-dGTP diphosphatase